MKVLFVLPYTPTPIRTRPYNLLHGLIRRGHALTLGAVWGRVTEHFVWLVFGVQVQRYCHQRLFSRLVLGG